MIVVFFGLLQARAGIALDAAPVAGADVTITVTDDFGDPRSGETVRVMHSPDLAAVREVAVGITDGRGQVKWTPVAAGVAELRVGNDPKRVRIAPDRLDPTTALLLGLLGIVGLGATVVGLSPLARRR